MGNLLDHAGYQRHIWIDFFEEVTDLLRKLGESLQLMDGAAADILLNTFNDPSTSMAIITYVKVSIMHGYPLRLRLTRAATCQCLVTDACRRVQALRPNGRRQGVLRQQHRAVAV